MWKSTPSSPVALVDVIVVVFVGSTPLHAHPSCAVLLLYLESRGEQATYTSECSASRSFDIWSRDGRHNCIPPRVSASFAERGKCQSSQFRHGLCVAISRIERHLPDEVRVQIILMVMSSGIVRDEVQSESAVAPSSSGGSALPRAACRRQPQFRPRLGMSICASSSTRSLLTAPTFASRYQQSSHAYEHQCRWVFPIASRHHRAFKLSEL